MQDCDICGEEADQVTRCKVCGDKFCAVCGETENKTCIYCTEDD